MRWVRPWRWLAAQPGAGESWTASCGYGAPFRKEFAFLHVHADTVGLHRPCVGGHRHTPIAGALTKLSAIYTPGLATALAHVAQRSIAARLTRAAAEEVSVAGSERVALNELVLGSCWEVVRQWGWRRPAHINLLEAGCSEPGADTSWS